MVNKFPPEICLCTKVLVPEQLEKRKSKLTFKLLWYFSLCLLALCFFSLCSFSTSASPSKCHTEEQMELGFLYLLGRKETELLSEKNIVHIIITQPVI